MGRFEWIIVELIVVGLLVYELISIRRTVRRDRENAALADDRAMGDAADHVGQGQHENDHKT